MQQNKECKKKKAKGKAKMLLLQDCKPNHTHPDAGKILQHHRIVEKSWTVNLSHFLSCSELFLPQKQFQWFLLLWDFYARLRQVLNVAAIYT